MSPDIAGNKLLELLEEELNCRSIFIIRMQILLDEIEESVDILPNLIVLFLFSFRYNQSNQ